MCAGLLAATLTRGQGWGDDFAAYVSQAQALAAGDPGGFVAVNRRMMAASSYRIGPDAYPWGFPLLLSPIVAVAPMNFLAMKLVGAASLLGLVAAMAWGFGPRHSLPGLALLLGVVGWNPALLAQADQVLSDLPFVALSTATVLAMGRARRSGAWAAIGPRCALGALMLLAFGVRAQGVALLGPLIVIDVLEARRHDRRPPGRALVAPYLVFGAGMLIFAVGGGGSGYAALLGETTLRIVVGNVRYYLTLPREMFAPLPGARVLGAGAVLLALLGLARRIRGEPEAATFMALVLAPLLPLTFRQGLRYALPLVPFAASFAVTGLEAVLAVAPRWVRASIVGVVLLVLTGLTAASVQRGAQNLAAHREPSLGPLAPASRALFDWVRAHTPEDVVVVFFKPRAMRLFTGREAIMRTDLADVPTNAIVALYEGPDAYDQPSRAEFDALAAAGGGPVYANPHFRVARMIGNQPHRGR